MCMQSYGWTPKSQKYPLKKRFFKIYNFHRLWTVANPSRIVRFSWKSIKKSWFSWIFELCLHILDPWTLCRGTTHRRTNGAVLYRHQPRFFENYNRKIMIFETFFVSGNLQNGQKSSKIHDYWLYPSQDMSELLGSLQTRPICRLISLTSLL